MEKIFLETSVQLVSEGSSELSERQAEALEKLTFDWVLNAEKYVDARFSELYKAREKVLASGSKLSWKAVQEVCILFHTLLKAQDTIPGIAWL